MNRGPSPDDPDRVIINCACGNQWGLPRVHWAWIENNEALVIGMAMVLLLGLYWFHQFDTGRL